MALSRGGIFLKHELERGQFLYENVLEGSRFQHFTVWTTPPPPLSWEVTNDRSLKEFSHDKGT